MILNIICAEKWGGTGLCTTCEDNLFGHKTTTRLVTVEPQHGLRTVT